MSAWVHHVTYAVSTTAQVDHDTAAGRKELPQPRRVEAACTSILTPRFLPPELTLAQLAEHETVVDVYDNLGVAGSIPAGEKSQRPHVVAW
jgi:hypothetical protein